MDVFLHIEEEDEKVILKRQRYYECIIENGFSIYILMNRILDYTQKQGGHLFDDEDLNEFIAEFKADQDES